MGFFDTLLTAVGGGVAGFLTGGPVGAAVGAAGGLLSGGQEPSKIAQTRPALSTTGLTAASAVAPSGGLVNTLAGIATQQIPGAQALLGLETAVAGREQIAAAAAVAGMAGKNRVITTVTTLNPAGQIVKQKQLAGRPFLMNKDLVIAKRVFRTIAKASGKMPRKVVKEGTVTQLKNAVVDKALQNVITDNGNGGKC